MKFSCILNKNQLENYPRYDDFDSSTKENSFLIFCHTKDYNCKTSLSQNNSRNLQVHFHQKCAISYPVKICKM